MKSLRESDPRLVTLGCDLKTAAYAYQYGITFEWAKKRHTASDYALKDPGDDWMAAAEAVAANLMRAAEAPRKKRWTAPRRKP